MTQRLFRRLICRSSLLIACLSGLVANAVELDLRVMSFNIRNGNANDGENHWNLRKEFVYDVIREGAPDVLGVQEAVRFQLDVLNQHLPEYAEVGVVSDRTRHTGQYSAILYLQERFEARESGTFWLSDTPEIPSASWGNHHLRICTRVRLFDKQAAESFYVYNTHLDDGSQVSREKAAQLMMQHYHAQKSGPTGLDGGFECRRGQSGDWVFDRQGRSARPRASALVDTFREIHPEEQLVGTYNGFEGRASGAEIDYIFVSPEFRTLDAAIVTTRREGRYPSDHFPVTSHLRLEVSVLP